MIYIKTEEEIEIQRESSLLVGKTLAEVAKYVAPGITTLALDAIAETFIKDHGAVPGFKGYGGFPGSCVFRSTIRLFTEFQVIRCYRKEILFRLIVAF